MTPHPPDPELKTHSTKALAILQDIRDRSLQDDLPTALRAQVEINKLLDLFSVAKAHAERGEGENAPTADGGELDAVASHLLPLNLAPATYPLSEHARIAADMIRRQKEAG